MNDNVSGISRRLMDSFLQFERVQWRQRSLVGLKHSELLILYTIKCKAAPDGPGIKVSELSELLRVTSPTVTQFVKNLESRGFIERGRDHRDRRACPIKLTEKGEATIEKALYHVLKSFDGLVEYLGKEDSSHLILLLGKVSGFFDEMKRQSPLF